MEVKGYDANVIFKNEREGFFVQTRYNQQRMGRF